MAEGGVFPLFGLPRDMQRLIVAELPRPDLGRFARVSRAARDLAHYWFASAEYGRRLCRALSGAEPPGPLPELFRHAYALGFCHWDPDRRVRPGPAAYLLEWAAVFGRGGLREEDPPRARAPRREVLAMIGHRLHMFLKETAPATVEYSDREAHLFRVCDQIARIGPKPVERWVLNNLIRGLQNALEPGTRLGEDCLAPSAESTEIHLDLNYPIHRLQSAVEPGIGLGEDRLAPSAKEEITEDRLVLVYCLWAAHKKVEAITPIVPGEDESYDKFPVRVCLDAGWFKDAKGAGLLYVSEPLFSWEELTRERWAFVRLVLPRV